MAKKAWAHAEEQYRRALGCGPQHVNALNNLAVAVHRQGRHDEAFALFEQVARLSPTSDLAQRNLYVALRRRVSMLRLPAQARPVVWALCVAVTPVVACLSIVLVVTAVIDRVFIQPRRLGALSPSLAAFYRYQGKRQRAINRAQRGPIRRWLIKIMIGISLILLGLLLLVVVAAWFGSR